MAELIDSMLAWLAENEGPWAYLAFAFASMLEYVVPPLPGDTIALFGVFLCASAGWSTPLVYLALNTGSVVGGMIAYGAGRWLRARQRQPGLLSGPRASAALRWLELRYARHGALFVAVNRFVPALRAFFFVAAGLAGLGFWRVAFFGLVSALAWNALLMLAGHALGASFSELSAAVGVYGALVMLAIVVAVLVAVARAFSRRLARRAGIDDGATAREAEEEPHD